MQHLWEFDENGTPKPCRSVLSVLPKNPKTGMLKECMQKSRTSSKTTYMGETPPSPLNPPMRPSSCVGFALHVRSSAALRE